MINGVRILATRVKGGLTIVEATLKVSFKSGSLTLEGLLHTPQGEGSWPAVLVCHPHPLYGGSMYNLVVYELCKGLSEAGFIALRFNFRGVGWSEGSYGEGVGEREDVEGALKFLLGLKAVNERSIGLAGYSFGAYVGLAATYKDQRVKALAAISPPVSLYDFSFLKDCIKPKLLICGDKDQFTPKERFMAFCSKLPSPKLVEVVPYADHFWLGLEKVVSRKVVGFLVNTLRV